MWVVPVALPTTFMIILTILTCKVTTVLSPLHIESDVSVTEVYTDRYMARVHVLHALCMNVCVLYIALASFIYTWDYVSQKNA